MIILATFILLIDAIDIIITLTLRFHCHYHLYIAIITCLRWYSFSLRWCFDYYAIDAAAIINIAIRYSPLAYAISYWLLLPFIIDIFIIFATLLLLLIDDISDITH